jgi:hypothetical protein
MSLSHYIDRHLLLKNRAIYFKNGRWIFHVVIVFFVLAIDILSSLDSVKNISGRQFAASFLPLVPFWMFFYYYCLYMVPYLFKRNQYRKFWVELILLIAILPPIYFLIRMATRSLLPGIAADFAKHTNLSNLGTDYFTFISIFVVFTSMLYLLELLEEINTVKETDDHNKEQYTASLNKIKTQINPVFMSESLEAIIALAEIRDDSAAGAVIHFADVLRYRLYKSRNKLVPVEQEIIQLKNLFELRNSFPFQTGKNSLEIEGDLPDARMVPLTLINLVESLLTFGKNDPDWSLLMYLLTDEDEIQVAIEINTPTNSLLENQFEKIKRDLEQLTYDGINFTIEKEPNNYSLRTCIPIFKNSIA